MSGGKIGKLGVWAGLGLAAICAAQEVGDMDEHQKYSSYQYRFFPEAKTWGGAEATCRGYGGNLATIQGNNDNERVYWACWSQRCWFGLNDQVAEGTWKWADQSDAGGFSKWAPGEPNNHVWDSGASKGMDEDCAYLYGTSYSPANKRQRWGDHPCNQKLPFVCEIPVNFRLIPDQLDWVSAESACKLAGGHLAHVESAIDNANVLGACKTDRCWIGLNDRGVEGRFEWTDGSKLGNIFKKWAAGEPSNTQYTNDKFVGTTDEDCVYLHGSSYSDANKRGQWGDHPCVEKRAAVCSVPAKYVYQYFATPATWADASASCKRIKGNLADVKSYGENGRVLTECQAQRCWIGANDRYQEGDWQWTDGTSLGLVTGKFAKAYVNWARNEPDNTLYADGYDEDCAYLHGKGYQNTFKQGQWGDHPCREKMAYVCQVPIAEIVYHDYSGTTTADEWQTPFVEEGSGGLLSGAFGVLGWVVKWGLVAAALAALVFMLAQRGLLNGELISDGLRKAKGGCSACYGIVRARMPGAGGSKAAAGHYVLMSNDPMQDEGLLPKPPGPGDMGAPQQPQGFAPPQPQMSGNQGGQHYPTPNQQANMEL